MKPDISKMTLREKLGQTGIPSPSALSRALKAEGGYVACFTKYPFAGMYVNANTLIHDDGNPLETPETARKAFDAVNAALPVPMLISGDCEYGANTLYPELHAFGTNMAMGAAGSEELAYKRAYYWAKEMHSMGVNWPFSPVVDLHTNFFSTGGIRRISADPDTAAKIAAPLVRGIQDAGVAASAKHFPGAGKDYRDTHFCSNINTKTMEEWNARDRKVWQAAIDAGVMTVMTSHSAVPAMDDSCTRAGVLRPASASKKVIDILRKDLGFQGLVVTDAVSMKGLTAAFAHEEMYMECFNAGNDIILFCDMDYIDVMEKAVQAGRVTVERVDEACRRVLELKEKLGLYDNAPFVPLTDEEQRDIEAVSYEIGKKAMTLVCNRGDIVPFDPQKVKNAAIINVSPDEIFRNSLETMKEAFATHGIRATVYDRLANKKQLKELSKTNDIIVYACFLAQSRPLGMSVYSRKEELHTLYHSLSYGSEKSVAVSFGATSIYYNYFESTNTFINAYSPDHETIRAFVDGILGKFPFTGRSPVPLYPQFRD